MTTTLGENVPTQSHQTSVVLCNVYADSNKGGAAITQITGRFARAVVPGARLVLITVPADGETADGGERLGERGDNNASRLLPILKTPGGMATLAGLLKGGAALLIPHAFTRDTTGYSEIERAALVVSKGGYLFGHRSPKLQSMLGLVASSYPLLFAWRLGIPSVAYSTSVGPFSSRLHRFLVGSILRRISVVMVRDAASEERALGLAVDRRNLIRMPDCVFSWDERHRTIDAPPGRASRLAFVLREIGTLRQVLPVLEKLAMRLAEDGTFSEFEGVVQSVEDRTVTTHFVERLQELGLNAALADTSEAEPSEVLATYGRSAATVSLRLHGAIFSILAGTPAIALATDAEKVEGVLSNVGLGHLVITPASAISSDALYEHVFEATTPAARSIMEHLVEEAGDGVMAAEAAAALLLRELHNRG